MEALNAPGNAPSRKNFCDSPKSVAKVIVDFIEESCIFHLKICGKCSNIVVWETVVWVLKRCTAFGTYSWFLTLATNSLSGDCNTETARKHSKTLLLIAILHRSLRKDQIGGFRGGRRYLEVLYSLHGWKLLWHVARVRMCPDDRPNLACFCSLDDCEFVWYMNIKNPGRICDHSRSSFQTSQKTFATAVARVSKSLIVITKESLALPNWSGMLYRSITATLYSYVTL